MDTAVFLYCNAKGIVKHYHIADISQDEEYIQGICLDSGDLKTFRQDRVISHHSSPEEAEQAMNVMLESGELVPYVPKPRPWETFDVCFTGYTKAEKEELSIKAEAAGLTVRKDVTVHLNLLCCGPNAGPSKIKKSREKGILILSTSQFLEFIETGEIPVDDSAAGHTE